MDISDTNQLQLEIIGKLKHLFETNNISFWLIGGWGIDFLAGRITREHEDIDIILSQKDFIQAFEILKNNYVITDSLNFTKIKVLIDNIKIDICFYVNYRDELFIDLDVNEKNIYPTPYDSFPSKYQVLHNLSCRTVSWSAQYVAKEGYYYYCNKKKRTKDLSDLSIINQHLSDSSLLNIYFPGVAKPEDMYRNFK